MANHASAKKRIRQTETKRIRNKYFHKTMRNALREIRENEDKKSAEAAFPVLTTLIDKVAKMNIIHKNKAANLKSGIAKKIASLV
jgi:small subunit ribosomal protein S20|tara:strand:+ start:125 stop:379 length:255 start_codon:yes stop_codon:yes gene_type:complete